MMPPRRRPASTRAPPPTPDIQRSFSVEVHRADLQLGGQECQQLRYVLGRCGCHGFLRAAQWACWAWRLAARVRAALRAAAERPAAPLVCAALRAAAERSAEGALAGRGLRLPRQRALRCAGRAFAFQCAGGGRRALGGLGAALMSLGLVLAGLFPGGLGCGRLGRHLDAGAPGLRQADRDGLLGRPHAVLAFTHVFDLFADEFAGLRGRRLALFLVALRASEGFAFGHDHLHRSAGSGWAR